MVDWFLIMFHFTLTLNGLTPKQCTSCRPSLSSRPACNRAAADAFSHQFRCQGGLKAVRAAQGVGTGHHGGLDVQNKTRSGEEELQSWSLQEDMVSNSLVKTLNHVLRVLWFLTSSSHFCPFSYPHTKAVLRSLACPTVSDVSRASLPAGTTT